MTPFQRSHAQEIGFAFISELGNRSKAETDRSRTRSPQSCSRVRQPGAAGSTVLVPELQRPTPIPQSPFPPRPAGPSTPPPPRSRSLGPPLYSASGRRDWHQPHHHGAAREPWEGEHPPAAPVSTPPSANLLQSWLPSSGGAVGRTALDAQHDRRREPAVPGAALGPHVRMAPPAVQPRRGVQLGPRAQLPAVCIPPPAATPACAGSCFYSAETPPTW